MGQSTNSRHQGSREAQLERYVLPEVGLLFRVALGLTRNRSDAEDLVQETLLRAYRGLESFDGSHPRAWLLTILRNAHLNSQRRRRPQLLTDPEPAFDAAAARANSWDDPEQLVVGEQFDESVEGAYQELPGPFREVVTLVDVHGLSYQEASRILSIPVGTVMSRLHRARSRMRKSLVSRGFRRGRGT